MSTLFFDVDTQLDFLLPAGALYVPGAETLLPALGRLTAFAAHHKIPLLSTMDAHSEDDPEFATWKPHCVVHTTGQQKALATSLARTAVLPSTPRPGVELQHAMTLPQILVEKQQTDCFSNVHLKPLLELLHPDLCIVYGVVTEICVQQAALGLLNLGYRVQIVADAIRSLDNAKADAFLKQSESMGATLTDVAAICGG